MLRETSGNYTATKIFLNEAMVEGSGQGIHEST